MVSFDLDASGLLRSVTQFSHLAADTLVNTAATSHSAPTDQADRTSHTLVRQIHRLCSQQPVDALACFSASVSGLINSCRDCANSLLQFLKDLKFENSLPGADASAVRYTVQRIHALGEVRRAQSSLRTQLWLTQDVYVDRNTCL